MKTGGIFLRKKKLHLLCTSVFILSASLAATNANAGFYNLSGFDLSAKSKLSYTYDDNIYSDNINPVDDTYARLNAELRALKRAANDTLLFSIQGMGEVYNENPKQDQKDFRLRGDWRHSFSDSFSLRTRYDYRYNESQRGNPFEDPGTISTEGGKDYTNVLNLDAAYKKQRFKLDFGVSGLHKTYENTARADSTLIINSARNRTDIQGYIKSGYIIAANTTAYAKGEFLNRRYENNTSASNKDTNGYVAALGLNYNIPKRLTLDAWIGYLNYNYSSNTLKNTNIPTYGLRGKWEVSDALKTDLKINRTLSENISETVSAIVTDTISLDANYELFEDWLVTAGVSYNRREYRHGAGATDGKDRFDDYLRSKIGVSYQLSENWALGADYENRERESNSATGELSRNIYSLFINANF